MNSVYQYQYKHRQYSAPSPVFSTSSGGSSLNVRQTSATSLGMRKLRYLRVSSRILERNFYESAQINHVEQHSEQSRKPSTQQWIIKKAERYICRRCIVSDQQQNLLTEVFLAGYTFLHERYDINIYTQRTTKLFTPIIKSFVAVKVLIQNKRTRWFTA